MAKVLDNKKYKLIALKGNRQNKRLIDPRELPYVGILVLGSSWGCMGNLPKDFLNGKWPKNSSCFFNEKNSSSTQDKAICEFVTMLQNKCKRTEPVKIKDDYINGMKYTYHEKQDYEKYRYSMQEAFSDDIYNAYEEYRENK